MAISLKLFIWRLSRKIVRIEIAGKKAAIEKSRAVIGGKRINHLCTIFKLFTNSFSRQRTRLEVLINRWLLSSGSYLGWGPIVESPQSLSWPQTPLEWGKMTGRRATFYASTVFSFERALDACFVYLFIIIEGNAVSVINLNNCTCMKSFTWKLVKKTVFFEKKNIFF